MEGLTEGRIVHYVPFEHEVNPSFHHLAAIVTQVFSPASNAEGVANLTVFPDWSNDGASYLTQPMFWATSRLYSAEPTPGTWHWPERA